MMDDLRMKDRELVSSIYDIQTRLALKEGFSDDKVLQSMIDDMKRTTKVQRDIKVADIFDLSFVKKANEEIQGERLEAVNLLVRHPPCIRIKTVMVGAGFKTCLGQVALKKFGVLRQAQHERKMLNHFQRRHRSFLRWAQDTLGRLSNGGDGIISSVT